MTCDPKLLKDIPLFSLLDDDEAAVLAAQVERKEFAPRERIYKKGDPGGQAYMVGSNASAAFWAARFQQSPRKQETLMSRKHEKYERLLAMCKSLPAARTEKSASRPWTKTSKKSSWMSRQPGNFLDSHRCWSKPRTTPRRLRWNRLRVWKFRATTS